MHYKTFTIPVIALGLILAACGSQNSATTAAGPTESTVTMGDMATDDSMDMVHDDTDHVFEFGQPAEASASARVIEVETLDTFAFTPDPITVKVGETVTFHISNNGNLPHDVVLDDQAGQDTHEMEMQEMAAAGDMMMMADEANGFSLPAGESKDLTWAFTKAGTVYIGCHQPGHFAAGMVVSVIVEP